MLLALFSRHCYFVTVAGSFNYHNTTVDLRISLLVSHLFFLPIEDTDCIIQKFRDHGYIED